MPLFTHSRQRPDTLTTTTGDGPAAPDGTGGGTGGGGGRWFRHPAVARVLTVLSALLVLTALLLPNNLDRLTPGAFGRIPVEGLLGAVVLVVLPPRPRRVAAVLFGLGLGLLTLLNFLDMGFYSNFDRPFDVRLDWVLFDDGEAFVRDSVGGAAAIGAVIGVVVLVVAVLVLMTLAVVRLSGLLVRHRGVTIRTTAVLGTAWIACAALGAQIAGAPVAARNAAALVDHHARLVGESWRDQRELSRAAAVDAFADTPPDQLLTALRGKDVIFAFIESYGRNAIEEPQTSSEVGAMLADGTEKLRKAGFSSRSAFLTSPTYGGGSWLAHSTFNTGLWIKNQQGYDSITTSDRMSLTSAFKRTDAWRTVGIMPGVTQSWPEGKFYGLDHVYDSSHLGYQGPKFGWSPIPDQYSLSAFEQLEHGKKDREPLMAEIILVSSHNPWAPLPKTIGWDQVGDGSVYEGIKAEGKTRAEVWKDPKQVRAEYAHSVEYSVSNLVDYVVKYGDKNTVLVFLGDHQPVPTVTHNDFGRDVPIAMVAHDPKVLDRISGWGWQDGLKPGPDAPVWRMDQFRDRFLTAYGSTPTP
ncbi:sulfatase [Streptomyces sp. NPDC087420]|uniref:sulfatase n=1 Tax=Streptomyces sp. NPDC087420 TaxID=3365785 RepID=UPI003836F777